MWTLVPPNTLYEQYILSLCRKILEYHDTCYSYGFFVVCFFLSTNICINSKKLHSVETAECRNIWRFFFGTHVRNHWPQSANFKNSSHVFVGYVFFFCYSLKVISWLCFHFYKYSHSGSVSILSCRFIQHILENHNKKCSIHSLAFVYSGSVSMIKMNWNFKNESIQSYFNF